MLAVNRCCWKLEVGAKRTSGWSSQTSLEPGRSRLRRLLPPSLTAGLLSRLSYTCSLALGSDWPQSDFSCQSGLFHLLKLRSSSCLSCVLPLCVILVAEPTGPRGAVIKVEGGCEGLARYLADRVIGAAAGRRLFALGVFMFHNLS